MEVCVCGNIYILYCMRGMNEVNENIRSIKFEKQTTQQQQQQQLENFASILGTMIRRGVAWHRAPMQLSKSRCVLHY